MLGQKNGYFSYCAYWNEAIGINSKRLLNDKISRKSYLDSLQCELNHIKEKSGMDELLTEIVILRCNGRINYCEGSMFIKDLML